jgi:hypothetical protein
MPEQVEPFLAEVPTQRVDVVGQPVHPAGAQVGRHRGGAGAAGVRNDQLPGGGQAAEVAEVRAGPPGTAGHADQGRPVADHAVGQLGAVVRGEEGHAVSLPGWRGARSSFSRP